MERMSTEQAREKGRKGGLARKGKKNKKTIVREELEQLALKAAQEGKELTMNDITKGSLIRLMWLRDNADTFEKIFMIEKELLKYGYPQKKEIQGNAFDGNVILKFKY